MPNEHETEAVSRRLLDTSWLDRPPSEVLQITREVIERIVTGALECADCERLDCVHEAERLLDALLDAYRRGVADSGQRPWEAGAR